MPSDEQPPTCPAPPCVSIEDIDEIKRNLRELRTAIVGDPIMGHRGIIARLTAVERVSFLLTLIVVALIGDRIIKFFL